jgi:hypothetical protein
VVDDTFGIENARKGTLATLHTLIQRGGLIEIISPFYRYGKSIALRYWRTFWRQPF